MVLATLLAGLTLPARAGEESIRFRDACAAGERVRVVAVGDILFHKRLQLQAYEKGRDFKRFFSPLADFLARADILYGNLESPAAAGVALGGVAVKDPGRRLDGRVYSADLATLNFNIHPSAIDDLKAVGFDVLSTANNHAYDRGPLGIDRTLEALDAAGMPATGTRKRGEVTRPWHVITRARGVTVAWLACTYSLNGHTDRQGQALFCFEEQEAVLAEIRALASRTDVDAVILVPHWGIESSHVVERRQRDLAREAIEAGATAVIGTHPHVLQPWERIVATDGREGLAVYSTGNFISNQRKLPERTGVIVVLDLVKVSGGKAKIASAAFVPTWVEIDDKGHRVTEMKGSESGQSAVLKDALRHLPDDNRMSADATSDPQQACPAGG